VNGWSSSALDEARLFDEHLPRGKPLVSEARVERTWWRAGSYFSGFHAEKDGPASFFDGALMITFFHAVALCRRRLRGIGEEAGFFFGGLDSRFSAPPNPRESRAGIRVRARRTL